MDEAKITHRYITWYISTISSEKLFLAIGTFLELQFLLLVSQRQYTYVMFANLGSETVIILVIFFYLCNMFLKYQPFAESVL